MKKVIVQTYSRRGVRCAVRDALSYYVSLPGIADTPPARPDDCCGASSDMTRPGLSKIRSGVGNSQLNIYTQ